jgi:hypothetical protein
VVFPLGRIETRRKVHREHAQEKTAKDMENWLARGTALFCGARAAGFQLSAP